MSDFLQIEDEIIDGDPQYLVTDNVNGTKSITLANEVIHEGTSLNHATFKSLNAILGYNKIIPTQEILESIVRVNSLYSLGTKETINATGTDGYIKTGTHTITVSRESEPITFNYKATFNNCKNTSYLEFANGSHFISFRGIPNVNATLSNCLVEITFPKAISVKNNIVKDASYDYGSGSVVYYDINGNRVDGTSINVVKMEVGLFGSQVTSKFGLVHCNIQEFADYESLNANIYIDNNLELADNVMYMLQPLDPNLEIAYANTLNGISIDTLLQYDKYYELLYDETNDRFIAEEVRV